MYRSLEWLVKLLPTQLEYHTLRGQTALVGDAEDWILIVWFAGSCLGDHAYLQYSSRSKGIGHWKHHILGSQQPKMKLMTYTT